MISVYVEYDGGWDIKLDGKIEKICKSGKWMGDGLILFMPHTRDFQFKFKNLFRAKTVIQKLRCIKGVRAHL